MHASPSTSAAVATLRELAHIRIPEAIAAVHRAAEAFQKHLREKAPAGQFSERADRDRAEVLKAEAERAAICADELRNQLEPAINRIEPEVNELHARFERASAQIRELVGADPQTMSAEGRKAAAWLSTAYPPPVLRRVSNGAGTIVARDQNPDAVLNGLDRLKDLTVEAERYSELLSGVHGAVAAEPRAGRTASRPARG